MIEKRLGTIYKAICRAGFLISYQIIKRKLTRSYLVEASERVKFSTQELESLIADTSKTGNTEKLLDNNVTGE
jgi:hypothetical protein